MASGGPPPLRGVFSGFLGIFGVSPEIYENAWVTPRVFCEKSPGGQFHPSGGGGTPGGFIPLLPSPQSRVEGPAYDTLATLAPA